MNFKGLDLMDESLSLDDTEVNDQRRVFHVQMQTDDGSWRPTNWGNPEQDETMSWHGTWKQACDGLAAAMKSYPSLFFRVHDDSGYFYQTSQFSPEIPAWCSAQNSRMYYLFGLRGTDIVCFEGPFNREYALDILAKRSKKNDKIFVAQAIDLIVQNSIPYGPEMDDLIT